MIDVSFILIISLEFDWSRVATASILITMKTTRQPSPTPPVRVKISERCSISSDGRFEANHTVVKTGCVVRNGWTVVDSRTGRETFHQTHLPAIALHQARHVAASPYSAIQYGFPRITGSNKGTQMTSTGSALWPCTKPAPIHYTIGAGQTINMSSTMMPLPAFMTWL